MEFTVSFSIQGASSDEYDTNNKTPRMLAMGRRHRMLLKFLDKKDTGGESLWDWRYSVIDSISSI